MDTQLIYEISMFIDDLEVIDINWCSFLRTPISKTTSQCIIKCFIPQKLILDLTEKITNNDFPKITLRIYSIDESSQLQDKKIHPIFTQTLICIGISPEGPLRFTQNSIHCKLMLTHPVIYYMETNNTYNKILKNVTGYEVLKDYENWLTENYGDIFYFRHISPSTNKNNYKYEQILIKTSNDLNVPNYIIDVYKPNNNYCWYFFDWTNIDKEIKNEITCLYVNLSKLGALSGEKISDFSDSNMLTKIIREVPFTDFSKKFDKKEGHSFVFDTREIKYDHKKIQNSNIPTKTNQNEKVQLTDSRTINVHSAKDHSKKTIPQSSNYSRIYVPDDFQNAKQRFELNKQQVIKEIKRLVFIEVTSALPNYPTFGNKYDIEKSGKYDYTPLAIVNTFVRKTSKEHFCSLINKAVLIQYNTETGES